MGDWRVRLPRRILSAGRLPEERGGRDRLAGPVLLEYVRQSRSQGDGRLAAQITSAPGTLANALSKNVPVR